MSETLPRLIGVIHLPPLPGTPTPGREKLAASESCEKAAALAEEEARTLEKAGFDGIVIENFGDAPFFKDQVPPETIAAMSAIASRVRKAVSLPLGINILRNDARAALAVAAISGAQFIRVNVLSGLVASDQGLIEGDASFLIRERERLCPEVRIFADAHVKHARQLSSESISQAIEETALRAKADAMIVTGSTTGRLIDSSELKEATEAAEHSGVALYIGSGLSPENIPEIFSGAHSAQKTSGLYGAIVGSALRKDSRAGAPLELERARAVAKAFRSTSRNS